jgi:FMN phosphatase YigB (HAD superfamily)
MPRKEDIDALLYDFGGVIIAIDFERVFARWSELSGIPVDEIKTRFVHGEEYEAHECGRLDEEGFYAWMRKAIGFRLSDEQIREGWMRVFGPEFPQTVAAVRQLADRIPQYLFSNTNVEHLAVWSRRYAAAIEPFRDRFTSCELGARKPHPEAFKRVADRIGVPPGRILFFDDTMPNVEGARAAGLQAVHVRSPEDVLRAVRPWL